MVAFEKMIHIKWDLVFLTVTAWQVCQLVQSSVPTDHSTELEEIELEVPQFRPKPIEVSNKTLIFKKGETIRINCGVKGNPKPHVYFYKGDILLLEPTPEDPNPSRVRVERTTLRIHSAQPEDSGIYKCVAQNKLYNTSLTFELDVIEDYQTQVPLKPSEESSKKALSNATVSSPVGYGPKWTKLERVAKLLHAEPAGNTVRFRCPVEGDPSPTVNWFKNGKIIQKDDRVGGYKYRNQGQMIILESVVVSDKGFYMCIARNKYGSINHTYELDVIERLAHRPILKHGFPSNKTVYVGDDVQFNCEVYSDPHPHVQWLRYIEVNGSNVDFNQSYILPVVLKESTFNETCAETLHLKNVTEEDSGKYACLAQNYIGKDTHFAWLTVLKVPPPTTDTLIIPVGTETNIFIYGMCGVLIVLFLVAGLLFGYFKYFNGKDPPMLVRIENPDNIPPMLQIEVPAMLYNNEQAWRRMCLTVQEPFEFNIPPDLQWELKREDIFLLEPLDEGFFGQVYKAELVSCNNKGKEKSICAVKMLKSSRTEKDVLDLLTEMDQMKRVGKHRNIINLLGVCTQNGPLMLVIEYAEQGNLRDFLRLNRPQNMNYNTVMPSDGNTTTPDDVPAHDRLLTQKDLVGFAFQIARGLEYLAQKKCIHRDLAARNVLVTEDKVMKIADFGLARDIRSCDYYRKHTRGHLPYKWMALEAMSDNVFTHATDVWSFGILLWEIFSLGGSPYPGIRTGELVKFLRSGERLDQPQFASVEMYRLMRDCWEEDPNRRPNFRTLVEDLDRMLTETSNEDYIDFTATADCYDSSDSESSESDRSDDSVFVSNSASVSDGNVPFSEERDSMDNDPYSTPLLVERSVENIVQNEHARLQSDV